MWVGATNIPLDHINNLVATVFNHGIQRLACSLQIPRRSTDRKAAEFSGDAVLIIGMHAG